MSARENLIVRRDSQDSDNHSEWRFCLSWSLITGAILTTAIFIMLFWFYTMERSQIIGDVFMANVLNPLGYQRTRPIILAWTTFFGTSLVSKIESSKHCPYKCVFTEDRIKYADIAKVRVFNARDFSSQDIPQQNIDALNVFFTTESSMGMEFKWNYINNPILKRDYFNLTISYRQDSDIQYAYDVFEPTNSDETEDEIYSDLDVERAIDNKTELAFISLSNCRSDSKREMVVDQLKEMMPLKTVGKCYEVDCDEECMKNLDRQYYFYMAFEDSVCPNYLSEMFWRIKRLVVPIVLSRAVVPSEIPSYTYIAVDDFPTLREFVGYLFEVVKDRELYKSFFAWTRTYKRTSGVSGYFDPGCKLCKLAYQQRRHQVKDISKYLSHNQCRHAFGIYLLADRHNMTWEMS